MEIDLEILLQSVNMASLLSYNIRCMMVMHNNLCKKVRSRTTAFYVIFNDGLTYMVSLHQPEPRVHSLTMDIYKLQSTLGILNGLSRPLASSF